MERTNARDAHPRHRCPSRSTLAVVDVSFISLGLVLRPIVVDVRRRTGADIVALVKPQFEAGKGEAKGGVVRDPAAHRAVLERVVAAGAGSSAWARAT